MSTTGRGCVDAARGPTSLDATRGTVGELYARSAVVHDVAPLPPRDEAVRVLDIDNNYSPSGGGVRTYHERKLAWFRDHYDGSYAFVVPSDHHARVVDGRTTVYHVPAVPLGASGYRWIVRPGVVASVVDDFRPDVVEIGSPYVLPPLVGRAVRGLGAATVGFYHADVPDAIVRPVAARLGARTGDAAARAAMRWMGRVYGGMSATFAASRFVLEKLADAGVRRLFHTPLGVDLDVHHPRHRSLEWRRSLGVTDDQVLVLYMARIAPEKGIRRLFDSYPAWRDPARIRLVVAGHGPLEPELDAFLARHPDVVRLPYIAERAQVARAYASADVYLALGAVETFSLATSEALASGTPVVAPGEGGAGEQVERVAADLLFDPYDASSIAGAVARAAAFGPAARAALRAAVESLGGWDGVFERQVRYYRLVEAAQRSGRLDDLVPRDGRWHSEVPTAVSQP